MCAKKSCRRNSGLIAAPSQSQPPFPPQSVQSPPPSLERCGRGDGMRSDSTKTFHNGFGLGPGSPTFRAYSRICHSASISDALRMLSPSSNILSLTSPTNLALCATSSKQARDPTKLKRKLEPNFRRYFFAEGEIFDMNDVDALHRE